MPIIAQYPQEAEFAIIRLRFDAGTTVYVIDNLDSVTQLDGVPQSSVGAPLPMILCGEHFLHLAYLVDTTPPGWDFKTVRVVDEKLQGQLCVLVRFQGAISHMFGSPNDEAFSGHPLSTRGLRPYGAFEVHSSSWIRMLERMNSVHPNHRPERYALLRHLIFTFHDTTFECVASSFEVQVQRGSVSGVLMDSWAKRG